jgi:hypothetical protein
MTDRPDRRQHRRFETRFEMSCRKVGLAVSTPHEVHTVNVSPGGVYLHTTAGTLKRGDLLKVELSIPPGPGRLEFGGKLSGFAKVLRTDKICGSSTGSRASATTYGVALQFCRPPRFCV